MIVWLVISGAAEACPVYLNRRSFVPPLPPLPRNSWRLYALEGSVARPNWRPIPLQIDPMTESGDLIFFKDKESSQWPAQRIDYGDRIAFHKEDFGMRWRTGVKAPCATKVLYELHDPSAANRWAYLVSCEPQLSLTTAFEPPIRLEPEKERVVGERYAYHYLPTNHLIFNQIVLNPMSEPSVVASRNANQAIHGNVRNFFNLNFDKDDVESQLLDTRAGPVSLVGRLTFYLRVLFFKIDLKLNTAVSFFRDSVNVPMVINFPVDAFKRLRPTSGILFSWEIDRQASIITSTDADIPELNVAAVKAGTAELAKYGRRYCHRERCNYTLKGEIQGYSWAMTFRIPEPLVNYGFFPMRVNDTNAAQRDLTWNDSPTDSPDRIAIYLETFGLPKGEHGYDFWISVAPPGQSLQTECPQRVKVNGAIHL